MGKEYSAKGLQDKLLLNQEKVCREINYSLKELTDVLHENYAYMGIKELTNFLEVFMKTENDYGYVAKEFVRKGKKKNLRK